MTSVSDNDVWKWQLLHKQRLTSASASLKVGCSLAYQAAVRTTFVLSLIKALAIKVTNENKPNRIGVERAMARSFHCRCVSIPGCARDSSKVTSIRQRRTNRIRIWSGLWASSVDRKAQGSNSPGTSRTSIQRTAHRVCRWCPTDRSRCRPRPVARLPRTSSRP